MLMQQNQAAAPALGVTEAVLMPAQTPCFGENNGHFIPMDAPAPQGIQERQGSVAGRAVLRVPGIQLPGAGRMRSMSRGACVPKTGEGQLTTIAGFMEQYCRK